MAKTRLDQRLVDEGHFPSRPKAKAAIMAGLVFVNDVRVDKAGTAVASDAKLEVRGQAIPYVSRGGLKLARALQVFPIVVTDRVVIDVGASTGGFTDCLLQNGAAKVYAIDVGYGQLDWSLRQDPRVVVMERTNIRTVTPEMLADVPTLAVVDVAFISLTKFFQQLLALLADHGDVICLIKPQFEAGREAVGKKGVVRDPAVHRAVLVKLTSTLQEFGAGLCGLDHSPIRGPEGNIEYLAHFSKGAPKVSAESMANVIVERAHTQAH